jgi:hypothetical protein
VVAADRGLLVYPLDHAAEPALVPGPVPLPLPGPHPPYPCAPEWCWWGQGPGCGGAIAKIDQGLEDLEERVARLDHGLVSYAAGPPALDYPGAPLEADDGRRKVGLLSVVGLLIWLGFAIVFAVGLAVGW